MQRNRKETEDGKKWKRKVQMEGNTKEGTRNKELKEIEKNEKK